jgi:hypothetical protein
MSAQQNQVLAELQTTVATTATTIASVANAEAQRRAARHRTNDHEQPEAAGAVSPAAEQMRVALTEVHQQALARV